MTAPLTPHPSLTDLARDDRPWLVMVEVAGERWYLSRDHQLLDDPDDCNVQTYTTPEIDGPLSRAHLDGARVERGAEAVGIPVMVGIVSRGNARLAYEATRGK